MPAWLPSIPYPEPKEGFWLPQTATLNFCEEVSHSCNPLFAQLLTEGCLGLLCNHLLGRDRQHPDQSAIPDSCIQRRLQLHQERP